MVTIIAKDIVSIIPEEGFSWEDFFLFLCRNDLKPESPSPATETLSSGY